MPATMPAISETETELQIATFRLAGERYGVDVHHVQEIIKMAEITPVPRTPEWVSGVMNLRGRIIPVISLRKRLGLQEVPVNDSTRVILLDILETVIGMTVDSVGEVLHVPADTFAVSTQPTGKQTVYVKKVATVNGHPLTMLDLAKVIDFKAPVLFGEDFED